MLDLISLVLVLLFTGLILGSVVGLAVLVYADWWLETQAFPNPYGATADDMLCGPEICGEADAAA